MQITARIHDDVAAALDELCRQRHETLDEILNDLLRRSLREMEKQSSPRKPFRTMSVDCGTPLIANIDNVAEVLAVIEGEDYS
jgi:hypothetical protein